MNSERRALLIIVAGVIGAIGALFAWSRHEPSYRGRSLSRWLEYGYHTGLGEEGADRRTDTVVRRFGTQAIPTLLRLLQTKDNDAPPFEPDPNHFGPGRHTAWEYRYYGVRGFQVLGTEAKGAFPKVCRLFCDTNLTGDAATVLVAIAPVESRSIFRAGLTNEDASIRAASAWGLGSFGSNAVVDVPSLLVCLKDRNYWVRHLAAEALGKIGQDGAIVIPALVEAIHDPDRGVAFCAVRALGAFGRQATAAVPDMLKAMSETNNQGKSFQRAVSNTLQAISPAAVEKAGWK